MPLLQEHAIVSVWSNHPVFSENEAKPAQEFCVQKLPGEFD
jgi:hypothetical protein